MEQAFRVLKKYFGYDTFRPQQEEIIQNILNGRSTLVLMPTGGGKSLCYQVPALVMEGTALVISPLIALMKDQVEGLLANGVKAGYINSSMTIQDEERVMASCLSGEMKILYLSPEKALSLLPSFLCNLKLSLIAIDEAHCISQWGHDFRPEYGMLKNIRREFSSVPVIALTATAEKATRKDIIVQLELEDPAVFIASFDRPNLSLAVRHGYKKRKKIEEITGFINKRPNESGIVYCLSRKSTEEVAAELNAAGIDAAYYHAGMDTADRNRVQEDFTRDKIQIICATIAFGMGIDKSNIRWIIHYNLPKSMESYYQEIGRAGRDGLTGDTILYYNIGDLMLLNQFAVQSAQPELNKEKIRRMQHYAEASVCRRKILLSYFGERYLEDCGNCDICANPPKQFDGTVAAQKALSALARTGETARVNMLVGILRGSHSAELLERGYQNLKTYGAGREYSANDWQGYILQLLHLGLMEMAYDEGFSLKITDAGREVLAGRLSVKLAVNIPPPAEEKSEKRTSVADNIDLFNRLRKLRKLIADSEGLPAYVIFNDKTLTELSIRIPHTMEEFGKIQGVSESKLRKYGGDFLGILKQESQPVIAPVGTRKSDVTSENIKSYVDQMKHAGIRISPHVLGKILLGSDRKSVPEEAMHLPFFGILKGETNYKELGPLLKKQFAELFPAANDADAFFSSEVHDKPDPDILEEIKARVSAFPLLRPNDTINNEYILEQRKQFPRAYEPWTAEEEEIFREAIQLTRDLDVLSEIFDRNPGSLKSAYKKMVVV